MQLFEKWQSVTDTYKSFYEETEHLGLEVSTFLKHFCEANNTLSNAIFKLPKQKSQTSLVFRFKNAKNNNEIWEFIIGDRQDENKTFRDFIEACKRDGSKHLLKKQINKAKECLSLAKQYRDNKCAVWIRQEHRKRFYLA